jgi:hypothetical protein
MCMANGAGDVTFVRNTTVDEFVATANTTLTQEASTVTGGVVRRVL